MPQPEFVRAVNARHDLRLFGPGEHVGQDICIRSTAACIQEIAADSRATAICIREIAVNRREMTAYIQEIGIYSREIGADIPEITADHQGIAIYTQGIAGDSPAMAVYTTGTGICTRKSMKTAGASPCERWRCWPLQTGNVKSGLLLASLHAGGVKRSPWRTNNSVR